MKRRMPSNVICLTAALDPNGRGPRKATPSSWKPGQSGNPWGRPKGVKEIVELARSHAPECIERLIYWMREGDAKASVASALALLNRGCGLPLQQTELMGPNGSPLGAPNLQVNFVRPKQLTESDA